MRVKPGEGFLCDCGSIDIDREGDHYLVKGPAYHHRDNGSEWIICFKCEDKFQINPVVEFMDGAKPKGDQWS